MERMPISVFKARCLAVLERVRRTRKPVLITRFGQPVAEVVPPSPPERPEGWLGSLSGTGTVTGEIVSPAARPEDWDALKS